MAGLTEGFTGQACGGPADPIAHGGGGSGTAVYAAPAWAAGHSGPPAPGQPGKAGLGRWHFRQFILTAQLEEEPGKPQGHDQTGPPAAEPPAA